MADPTLEQRHFNIIAKAIKNVLDHGMRSDIFFMNMFTNELDKLCPNMDMDRFRKAAGLPSIKE